jgi:hypothetical protein
MRANIEGLEAEEAGAFMEGKDPNGVAGDEMDDDNDSVLGCNKNRASKIRTV